MRTQPPPPTHQKRKIKMSLRLLSLHLSLITIFLAIDSSEQTLKGGCHAIESSLRGLKAHFA
jgi:hypothetical protein